MLKRFVKDSAVYGISGVLSRGLVGLLLLPVYTRFLTPEQYGTVDLLQVARSLAVLIVALEISQGLVRLLPDAKSEGDRTLITSTAFWFSVTMYAAFVAVAFVLARPLSLWLLGTVESVGAFRVALFFIMSEGLFALFQLQLRFELRPTLYAIASVASLLIAAITTILLLVNTPLRASAVLLGLCCGNIVGALISYAATRKRFAFVFSWELCVAMLAFSAPLVLSGIAGFIAAFIDRIAIRQIMGVPEVGIFAVGVRIASVTSFVLIGIQMALTPLIYSHYTEMGTPLALARIFRLVLALLLPLVVTLGVFAPEVISRLATEAFMPAAVVVPIVACSAVLTQFWIFAPGLGLSKRTGTIAMLNIAAGAVNLALNYLLIPFLGLAGAAYATLVGSALTAYAYISLGGRHYHIPYEWRRILFAAAIAAVTLLAAGLLWRAIPASELSTWGEKFALCVLALASIILILVDRSEFSSLRRLLQFRPALRTS
jgi:O-antigen/teichoic acid export membrane protein